MANRKNKIPIIRRLNFIVAMIPAINGITAENPEGLFNMESRRIFSIQSNIPAKKGVKPI